MKSVILASASPRRKEILKTAGIPFEVVIPSADEDKINVGNPDDYVMQLAHDKAYSVFEKTDKTKVVIGVDTVVVIQGEILGKPVNKQAARKMMRLLSGDTHKVISGVCMIDTDGDSSLFVEHTLVTFSKLNEKEIEEYIDTDEPYDKAGGYAIQGLASKFVKTISGCYYNVMGLPLSSIYAQLKKII